MEHTKKMALVEPKLLENVLQRPQPPVSPIVVKLSDLDREMDSVLKNETLSADEKVKLYSDVLERYRRYNTQRLHPDPVKVEMVKPKGEEEEKAKVSSGMEDPVIEEIVESVPQTFRRRAFLLAKKIKASENMSWNENGELIFRGNLIPGTNMVDLVNDVLRKRKGRRDPPGHDEFVTGLRSNNVAKELIGNPRVLNALADGVQVGKGMKESSFTPVSNTRGRFKTRRSISLSEKPKRKQLIPFVINDSGRRWHSKPTL